MMIETMVGFALGIAFAMWQPELVDALKVRIVKMVRSQPCEHEIKQKKRFRDDHD